MAAAQPVPAPSAPTPTTQPTNGLGVASLVLGVASLVAAISFLLFPLALLGGVVGAVLGAVALGRHQRGEATNEDRLWPGSSAASWLWPWPSR